LAVSTFRVSAQEALNFAASQTGRPANLLEKDVWVVQALDVLFSSEFGPHLVFKGGTALSKVHRVIECFSEDVDVTYDIRDLAPNETANAMRPASPSALRSPRSA
jgi:predicted nucleotidyltransferase component of viral defense system